MKVKTRLGYLAQEIVIVVIGVLIAVSINNYKEYIDNRNYVQTTLQAIEKEIRLNQMDLDTIVERHLTLLEELYHYEAQEEQTLGELVAELGGVQVASIRNIGLRFFVTNKAELLDFDLISMLIQIEDTTEILEAKLNRLANFAYAHLNDTDEQTIETFVFMLTDVIDSETSLQEAYTEFMQTQMDVGKEQVEDTSSALQ